MILVTATVLLTLANFATTFPPAEMCQPTITEITDAKTVRARLDRYWEETGVLAVGLAVTKGADCTIYHFGGETRRAEEIYQHELQHCYSGSYHKL
jgi:hypothetical protein